MTSILLDAAAMARKASSDLERANGKDTGTYNGWREKRQYLSSAMANMHAALARIDTAMAESDAEWIENQ